MLVLLGLELEVLLTVELLEIVPWRVNFLRPKRRKNPFRNFEESKLYKIGLTAELR